MKAQKIKRKKRAYKIRAIKYKDLKRDKVEVKTILQKLEAQIEEKKLALAKFSENKEGIRLA